MAKAINGISGLIGGKAGKIIRGVTLIAVGIATGNPALIAGGVASTIDGLKKSSGVNRGRLNLSFDPDATRKYVFGGPTAFPLDVLYSEPGGTDQRYTDYIIAVAAHAVDSIDAIYSEDKLMWLGGTVQATYAGYLTVDIRLEGTAANSIPINGGAVWNSNCRLTGCAYFHIRLDRQGANSKTQSPFAGGLPGRMTAIGRGMKLYDPRRDSTRGGSGTMRANDQTTWAFTPGGVEIGQNPALQTLTFLLGWKIGGVVSVGVGMDPSRIDFADFITAANICDEAVTLAAGGTQRRYEGAGTFGDEAPPAAVLTELCANMNAELRDVNGKLGIRIATNDLGGALPAFTANDVLGEYEWTGFAALNDTNNVVRGKYTDASTASLYNTAPYSKISVASPDGIDRPETLDLLMCQNAERAQRIATYAVLRNSFNATFSATFGPRAWALRPGDPMTLTFAPAGLSVQKFRVISQTLKVVTDDEGAKQFCEMTLRADDPSVYAYTPGTVALPAAAVAAVSYNPLNNPLAVRGGSDIGVDNNATHGINQQDNASLAVDTTGWSLGFGARATAVSGAPTQYVIQTTAASSGAQLDLPKTSIIGGSRLFIQVWVYRSAGLTALNLAANTFDAVSGTGIGPLGGALSVVPNAAGGSGQLFTITGAAPMNAGTIQLSFYGLSGNAGTVQIGAPVISYSQIGADVTNGLEVPPSIAIYADVAGNVNLGELPRIVKGTYRSASADVSSSATWSSTTFTGCVGTVAADGTATITGCTSSGTINWQATYSGQTKYAQTVVDKRLASAPVTSGGGGGGGAPGGAASDTTITATLSATYGAASSDILSVVVGSSGQVNLTAPLDFQGSNPAGAVGCAGKWQWRISGGTFADVAAEITPTYNWDGVNAYSGHIDVTMSKTGLTSGLTCDFQLLMRKQTGIGTISFRNAATATPV